MYALRWHILWLISVVSVHPFTCSVCCHGQQIFYAIYRSMSENVACIQATGFNHLRCGTSPAAAAAAGAAAAAAATAGGVAGGGAVVRTLSA